MPICNFCGYMKAGFENSRDFCNPWNKCIETPKEKRTVR